MNVICLVIDVESTFATTVDIMGKMGQMRSSPTRNATKFNGDRHYPFSSALQ
eukprot:CAMPEP_0171339104 /NCGR_PEP_ID=MMETSP0878-20121228/7741_1 /TAXON_ID=67004 /ORGANISM="Thalassiosira weissflogii, Strain CCMP1336" /LENGTH=51 /DNA_ID=CAMNT_0011840967 /DNA_START=470 /DNA_END=625 /DNA_ORIENTATION=-